MKQIARMTQAELAAYVQGHLQKRGIAVVLSGGAAVSIYTLNKYVSRDIDLVNVYSVERKKIRAAMQEIGFQETSRYFSHPESRHIVEFPRGPLAIDNQSITRISKIKYTTGTLSVISPTDCVKDRLAAYYFWNDQQSLTQAIRVVKNQRVNMSELRRWSRTLGMMEKYGMFLRKLSPKSRKG
jgi:hypothetical protein